MSSEINPPCIHEREDFFVEIVEKLEYFAEYVLGDLEVEQLLAADGDDAVHAEPVRAWIRSSRPTLDKVVAGGDVPVEAGPKGT